MGRTKVRNSLTNWHGKRGPFKDKKVLIPAGPGFGGRVACARVAIGEFRPSSALKHCLQRNSRWLIGNKNKMPQPTLFSDIDSRIAMDREEGDLAYFHALMLKLEYLTKIVVAGIAACVGDDADRHRYSLEYKLVRADSLGKWVEVLNTALVGPPAQSLIAAARKISRDLTQQVGPEDWRHNAVSQLNRAALFLDANAEFGGKVALRRFFDIGVQMRNRSRGHGAPTTTQCGECCPHLAAAMDSLVSNMQLLRLPWVHLHKNLSGKYRVSPLLNDSAPFRYLRSTSDARLANGVYFDLEDKPQASSPQNVPLIFTSAELQDILLPNGDYKRKSFESLSYVSNTVVRVDGSEWFVSPTKLPASETEGLSVLEPLANAFTNVPPMPAGYVPRRVLEGDLVNELLKVDRHRIVTLTGPGGIGKTSVAIKAIRALCNRDPAPYDVVLWISARDVDLLDTGPRAVSRRVFTQQDIALAGVELLEPSGRDSKSFRSDAYFQECLSKGAAGPTLFVLDNFETLKNPADVFEWVDAHVRPPNKVLITTRFRDFRGDYPIAISGMLEDEANRLINEHGSRLDISHLVSESYKSKLISESDGHPYVIKILLGEVAKAGQAVTPKRIVATADDLLDALFKRTYQALSPGAQRVFLLLCSWKVYVPEIAVEVVLLRQETERFDVPAALEEVVKFSLVDQSTSDEDGERFVGAPLAAAMYGQRELKVSPLKMAIAEDKQLLMDFGAGKRSDTYRGTFPRIDNLVKAVASRVSAQAGELSNELPALEYLAKRFPQTYLRLAELIQEVDESKESMEKAKQYVRSFLGAADVSEHYAAWMKLAYLCQETDDARGEVHALCEAALVQSWDRDALSNIANRLNKRIRVMRDRQLDDAWSVEVRDLIQPVITEMENQIKAFSATECSRLAWLYLNVGNPNRALDVAKIGLEKEPTNQFCDGLVEKLQDF